MGAPKPSYKDIINKISKSKTGYRLKHCFGVDGCPNRVMESRNLLDKIKALLEQKDLKGFLEKHVKGEIRIHHEFSITLSDCPNACSQPQIVDIGLIAATYPDISDSACKGGGACVEVCKEDAIQLLETPNMPIIDSMKCLGCGQCIKICPSHTLVEGETGYRILLGGKLGRHPQLGRELNGLFSPEDTLNLIDKTLDFYMQESKDGERLGELLNSKGFDVFLNTLGI